MLVGRIIGDAGDYRGEDLAAGSSRVQITGNPKRARRDIYSGCRLSCHPRLLTIDRRRQAKIAISLAYSRESSLALRRRDEERNGSEKRRATRCSLSLSLLGEHVKSVSQRSSSFCATRIWEPQQGATFFLLRALAFYILGVWPTFENFADQFRLKIPRLLRYKFAFAPCPLNIIAEKYQGNPIIIKHFGIFLSAVEK